MGSLHPGASLQSVLGNREPLGLVMGNTEAVPLPVETGVRALESGRNDYGTSVTFANATNPALSAGATPVAENLGITSEIEVDLTNSGPGLG